MTEAAKPTAEWLHCNACARSTDHLIVHTHRNREFNEDVKDDYGRAIASIDGFCDWQLLECQGCKTVCLRSKEYFSEWADPWDNDPYKKTYYPPRNTEARNKPHWFDTFNNSDAMQGHFILNSYREAYTLIESEQYTAAMLMCRALLETIAIEHGDGDKKTFKAKLESLRDKELIRTKQIEYLDKAIYDAGSAVMHRSYNPSPKAVSYVLDAIEHLLHTIYIEPIVETVFQSEKPKRLGEKSNA